MYTYMCTYTCPHINIYMSTHTHILGCWDRPYVLFWQHIGAVRAEKQLPGDPLPQVPGVPHHVLGGSGLAYSQTTQGIFMYMYMYIYICLHVYVSVYVCIPLTHVVVDLIALAVWVLLLPLNAITDSYNWWLWCRCSNGLLLLLLTISTRLFTAHSLRSCYSLLSCSVYYMAILLYGLYMYRFCMQEVRQWASPT